MYLNYLQDSSSETMTRIVLDNAFRGLSERGLLDIVIGSRVSTAAAATPATATASRLATQVSSNAEICKRYIRDQSGHFASGGPHGYTASSAIALCRRLKLSFA